jgi:NADH:ubiquinone oxidoreductase subunit E
MGFQVDCPGKTMEVSGGMLQERRHEMLFEMPRKECWNHCAAAPTILVFDCMPGEQLGYESRHSLFA